VRHKAHTPAYARLHPGSNGALELCGVVNLSEEGVAVQTSAPLPVNHIVELHLDLSETRTTIRTVGQVAWSDSTGRVGIHFQPLPATSRQQLKQWFLANLLISCVNHAAEPELKRLAEMMREAQVLTPDLVVEEEDSRPDYTSLLTALGAVRRETERLAKDLDGALRLIAERAQTFARASGAALALSEGSDMVCRASAGNAPGIGARLKIGSGFSGECVRSGRLLRCEDSETDSIADRESCKALGIRSMIAVPIKFGDSVIGLLEVFSPLPNSFPKTDDYTLQRLAEMAAKAVYRAAAPEETAPASLKIVVDDEFPVETADAVLPRLPMSRKLLLASVAATVLLAILWVLGPWGGRMLGAVPLTAPASTPAPTSTDPQLSASAAVTASDFSGLRTLAEKGDAAAQFAVGAAYATGDDVPQDYVEAVRWFSQAAEQGHVVAQATLGAYYWAGRGVTPDLVKAYFWSVLAQAGGDEASKYRVAVLTSRMSHSQVLAAQQQANAWIREHQAITRNTEAAQ
jgi:putative methionine-R-sulfoxide reductase with GAF domain